MLHCNVRFLVLFFFFFSPLTRLLPRATPDFCIWFKHCNTVSIYCLYFLRYFYIWIQTILCSVLFWFCFLHFSLGTTMQCPFTRFVINLHLHSDTAIQCPFPSYVFYILIQTLQMQCPFTGYDIYILFTFTSRHGNVVSISRLYFLHFDSDIALPFPNFFCLVLSFYILIQPLC